MTPDVRVSQLDAMREVGHPMPPLFGSLFSGYENERSSGTVTAWEDQGAAVSRVCTRQKSSVRW